MIMEAIIVMISRYYNTMNIRNDSKSENVEKKIKINNKGSKKSVNV